jgi:hypothetical protein
MMDERRYLDDVPSGQRLAASLIVALVVGVIGWTVTWYVVVGIIELLRWMLM